MAHNMLKLQKHQVWIDENGILCIDAAAIPMHVHPAHLTRHYDGVDIEGIPDDDVAEALARGAVCVVNRGRLN